MFSFEKDKDTICAPATSLGEGAIAVIRVSGKKASGYTRLVCPFLPMHPETHRIYFGLAREKKTKTPIDEVLVSFFQEGKSFTGEETLEISCHGSPAIVQAIIDELVSAGCRLAEKGEFTYRAFLNGKIDLVQAESVLSLIESHSKKAAQLSLRQLRGELSKKLSSIEQEIIEIMAHLEAQIDFSTENLEVADPISLLKKMDLIIKDLEELLKSYRSSKVLNEGVEVVLVGSPNAGKSKLLNALIGEEKAIVTSIPGTTRDLNEGIVKVNDLLLKFIDTAGVRAPQDEVEEIGIQKTLSAIKEGDYVAFVIDLSEGEVKEWPKLKYKNVFFIGNKKDLVNPNLNLKSFLLEKASSREIQEEIQNLKEEQFLTVSALTGENVENIKKSIYSKVQNEIGLYKEAFLFRKRHVLALDEAMKTLKAAKKLLKDRVSEEFILAELQQSLKKVFELRGKEVNEQVLDEVFSQFCIGK